MESSCGSWLVDDGEALRDGDAYEWIERVPEAVSAGDPTRARMGSGPSTAQRELQPSCSIHKLPLAEALASGNTAPRRRYPSEEAGRGPRPRWYRSCYASRASEADTTHARAAAATRGRNGREYDPLPDTAAPANASVVEQSSCVSKSSPLWTSREAACDAIAASMRWRSSFDATWRAYSSSRCRTVPFRVCSNTRAAYVVPDLRPNIAVDFDTFHAFIASKACGDARARLDVRAISAMVLTPIAADRTAISLAPMRWLIGLFSPLPVRPLDWGSCIACGNADDANSTNCQVSLYVRMRLLAYAAAATRCAAVSTSWTWAWESGRREALSFSKSSAVHRRHANLAIPSPRSKIIAWISGSDLQSCGRRRIASAAPSNTARVIVLVPARPPESDGNHVSSAGSNEASPASS